MYEATPQQNRRKCMNSKPNKDWGCVLLQGPQNNCRKDGVGDLGVYVGLATPIRFPGISTSLANFRRPLIHFHATYNILAISTSLTFHLPSFM